MAHPRLVLGPSTSGNALRNHRGNGTRASSSTVATAASAAAAVVPLQQQRRRSNQRRESHRLFSGVLASTSPSTSSAASGFPPYPEARRRGETVAAVSTSAAAAAAAASSSPSWQQGNNNNSTSGGFWKTSSSPTTTTRASASSSSSGMASSSSSSSTTTSQGRELLDAIADLPWNRVAVWAVVAWAAYQLKDFFGIFMGTFVVSFVGNGIVRSAQSTRLLSGVGALRSEKARRRVLVAGYFSLIVAACALFGVMTIPDIVREGADFVQRLKSDSIWVVVLEKVRAGVGDGLMDQVERFLLVAAGESEAVVKAGGKGAGALLSYASSSGSSSSSAWTAERTAVLGNVLAKMLRSYTDTAVALTSAIVSSVSRFAAQVAVSLVLSFVVVWDLPTIAAGIRSLETSRLSPIYKEVAPSVAVFGQLFGKALQAQARIALVNTGLTAAGLVALAIPGVGLLSLFVFLCSFIPIAGCFISTVPIAFVALTEYGFLKLALVILMVACIHVIEAYGLNPAIYSAHLKLHPLLVLTVLVVAEHSLGVWGLLLAVPLTVFVLDYAIRYPACSVIDVAERELQTIGEGSDEDDDDEDGKSGGASGSKRVRSKEGGGGGGGGGSVGVSSGGDGSSGNSVGGGGGLGSSSSARPLGQPPLGPSAPPPAWGAR